MSNDASRSHAAVPTDGRVPATTPAPDAPTTCAPPARLDANGFDPNEFEWRPVPRRPRRNGWNPDAQQRFIEALARTGVVQHACRDVGLSAESAYKLRNAPGSESFARAWKEALTRAADRVLDIAFEQAIVGEEVPVYDRDGMRVGSKWKYNTRMAMHLLRAYHPDRFRHAHRDTRHPDEPLPPPALPVPDVVASLAPVTPAEPHLLTPPDALAPQVAAARRAAAIPEEKLTSEVEFWRAPPLDAPLPCSSSALAGPRRAAAAARNARRKRIGRQATSPTIASPSRRKRR